MALACIRCLYSKIVLIACVGGIVFPLHAAAQNALNDSVLKVPKNVMVIQPQIHVGKLVKIYPEFPSSDIVNFNEVNVAIQTTGKREWNQLYRYPQIGFAFIYGYLGNSSVLGNSFAIIPNLAFERHNQKKWTFQTRFGMGFSYFNKYYDAIKNSTNNVIGSRVTNITFLSGDVTYKLGKSFYINAGISTFHCSNGHYQLPNLGANVPSVNFGIRYFPEKLPAFYKHDSLLKRNKKVLFNIAVGYGRHEFGSATKATGGPKYPVFQGSFYLSKRYKKVSNLILGASYTYYSDYYDFIVSQEYFDSQQHLKASVITVFIGHEFIIGKFGLLAQPGINVYNPFLIKFDKSKPERSYSSVFIANKIGVNYYLFDPTTHPRKNVYLGMYIKANFGTADYAQFAAGYTF